MIHTFLRIEPKAFPLKTGVVVLNKVRLVVHMCWNFKGGGMKSKQ